MIGITTGSEVKVVGLNGPKLKVHHVDLESNLAECIWFDNHGVLHREHLNINILEGFSELPTALQGEFPE